jgi:serine/threonine-protein kinase RsbW
VDDPKTIPGKPSGSGVPARAELLMRLHLESNPEALCLVRGTMQSATEVLHFREPDSRAIVRSVDEALANVIRHAYAGRGGLPIEVSCSRLWSERDATAPRGLEIVLADWGVAVDPKKLHSRSLEEVRPGGLGLHFIKESMDVVEFSRENGKNLLRMVKYLASAKPEVMPDAKPEEKPEGE